MSGVVNLRTGTRRILNMARQRKRGPHPMPKGGRKFLADSFRKMRSKGKSGMKSARTLAQTLYA